MLNIVPARLFDHSGIPSMLQPVSSDRVMAHAVVAALVLVAMIPPDPCGSATAAQPRITPLLAQPFQGLRNRVNEARDQGDVAPREAEGDDNQPAADMAPGAEGDAAGDEGGMAVDPAEGDAGAVGGIAEPPRPQNLSPVKYGPAYLVALLLVGLGTWLTCRDAKRLEPEDV